MQRAGVLYSDSRDVFFLLFAGLLSFLRLGHEFEGERLEAFLPIEWRRDRECNFTAPKGLPARGHAVSTYRRDDMPREMLCESYPLETNADILELELTGAAPAEFPSEELLLQLSVETSTSQKLIERRYNDLVNGHYVERELAISTHTEKWKTHRFYLGDGAKSKLIKLELISNSDSPGHSWLALRSRAYAYSMRTQKQRPSPGHTLLLSVAIAFLLYLLCRHCFTHLGDYRFRFALYCLLFFTSSFQLLPFFFYDEWDLMKRFSEMGLSGVVYTHNEHFLPLFFLTYYLENFAFGDYYLPYLCSSLFIHVLHCMLLGTLISELLGAKDRETALKRWIPICYLLSSLHIEALQWAFEQSLLLSQLLLSAAMLFSIRFVKGLCSARALAPISLSIFAAPFFFGNGFCAVLLVIICGFCALFLEGPHEATPKAARGRFLSLLILAILAFALSLLLYWNFRHGEGRQVELAKFISDLDLKASFLLIGIGAGTIFRGLGLSPAPLLPSDRDWSILEGLRKLCSEYCMPEFAIAGFGIGISLLSLLLICRAPAKEPGRKRHYICLWCMGHLLIAASLILPSIGRSDIDLRLSMFLRYHYGTLVGLCIAAIPTLLSLRNYLQFLGLPKSSLTALGSILLVAHLSSHIYVSNSYDYYTNRGLRHRDYVTKLQMWRELLAKGKEKAQNFEGKGTELYGLQPMAVESIIAERHPNFIYAVLDYLRS